VSKLQKEEEENGFDVYEKPQWYVKNAEPKPEAGSNKGLTLIFDRHSDALSPSTVTDNFQGFLTVIDDKNKFPLTSVTSLIARPGHVNHIEISAVKVESLEEIRQYSPEKRSCYFPDEYPLDMHQNYSQPNCLLECKVKFASECMKTCINLNETCDCGNIKKIQNPVSFQGISENTDTCIPWFYPVPDDKNGKMCNPWNTLKFQNILDEDFQMSMCKHCFPDCTTTVYDTSIAYATFQECDHTNTGANMLCDMVNGALNPAPWTYLAQTEYQNASPNESLPWYLETDNQKWEDDEGRTLKFPDRRSKSSNAEVLKNALFKSQLKKNPTYNAFEKDIGILKVFFGNAHSAKYIKKNRMSEFEFLSQVGGSIGLAMGISMVSMVELIYWFTLRLFMNVKNRK
jgi:hypothetical protein